MDAMKKIEKEMEILRERMKQAHSEEEQQEIKLKYAQLLALKRRIELSK